MAIKFVMAKSTFGAALTLAAMSLSLTLVATTARAQGAQTAPPIAQLLPEMAAAAARIAPGSSGDHSQHFVGAFQSVPTLSLLGRELALQSASAPLGPTASTVLFGPRSGSETGFRVASGYTESARTMGRGRTSLAITYQTTTYDTYDGLSLRGTDLNLFGEHVCCSGAESERDLMQETISLRLRRNVTSIVLGYGLANRIDVGVVVPVVNVYGDARVTARILRTATAGDDSIHNFASGEDPRYGADLREIGLANRTIPGGRQCPPDRAEEVCLPEPLVARTGHAGGKGLGDVLLRGKLRLLETGSSAVAVGVDVSLPTGSADDFIGLGATRVTPALLWSLDAGRVGARVRVHYTQSSGSLSSLLEAPGVDLSVPNEIGYEAGFDVQVAPRTTLLVDVLGRRLEDVANLTSGILVLPNRGPGPLPSAPFAADGALQSNGTHSVDLMLASFGGRLLVADGVYANARVLLPFGDQGLRPAPALAVALDYGF